MAINMKEETAIPMQMATISYTSMFNMFFLLYITMLVNYIDIFKHTVIEACWFADDCKLNKIVASYINLLI